MPEAKEEEADPSSRATADERNIVATGLPANYWQSLVQYTEDERGEPALGEFARLQAMNITHLLNEVVRIKANIEYSRTTSLPEMNLLRETLHNYTNAIRDFKYLTGLNQLPDIYALNKRISLHGAFQTLATPHPGTENHPYDTTYRTFKNDIVQNRDSVREFLRRSLPNRLSWTDAERRARRSDYSDGMPPEIYSPFLDSLARFITGTLGGCALIVPMVVMVLNQSLTKSLITVSVAVVLFALVLSLVFETDNKDTITATATYAAVLVVFVGTSGSTSGG